MILETGPETSAIPQGKILGTAVIGPPEEVQCMEQTEMPPHPFLQEEQPDQL